MESAEAAEQRRQRKKVQNRLNQRAKRSRKREQQDSAGRIDGSRPYQVDRWRHTYPDAGDASPGISTGTRKPNNSSEHAASSGGSSSSSSSTRQPCTNTLVGRAHGFKPPSPAQDHLLHLIHLNAMRGFFDNKLVLLAMASYLTKTNDAQGLQPLAPEQVFPGRAAITSTASNIPESLRPTRLQNTRVHATCLDLIPFAQIRDNLIEQEGRFSWAELIEDLVGHLVNPFCFLGPQRQQDAHIAEEEAPWYGDEDDFTANRNGIIVWGPAHRPESWEVTAGFLRKWGWSLKGCQDIIESTNLWRKTRGEEPLARSAVRLAGLKTTLESL